MDRNRELVWWDEILAKWKERTMEPAFRFKYMDRVWRKDMNPFVVGVVLSSWRDPDTGTIYCLIKSNKKNIYVAPEAALDFTKDPPLLQGPRGVDQVND